MYTHGTYLFSHVSRRVQDNNRDDGFLVRAQKKKCRIFPSPGGFVRASEVWKKKYKTKSRSYLSSSARALLNGFYITRWLR